MYYDDSMARNTTRVRLPGEIVRELDRRAEALGITRSELILQAVERVLAEQTAWSPAFLRAIGTRRPELDEAAADLMDAIRARRSRNEALPL